MTARAIAGISLLLLVGGCASTPLHPVPTFNYHMATRALAYSPDGHVLLVLRARQRNQLTIVDARTLRVVRTLTGSEGPLDPSPAPPGAIGFSPDGTLVAIAGLDDIVTVRDVRTWDLVARLPETKWASGVVFLRDSITLATAGPDGRVRFWNARTGALTGELSGHDGSVLSIGISPDGQRLATGGVDRTARVWDVATRSQIAVFDQRIAPIVSLAFSANGRQLATSANCMGAVLWDVDWPRDARPPEVAPANCDCPESARAVTPGAVVLRPLEKEMASSFCPVAISADGKLLAVSGVTKGLFGEPLAIYDMSSLTPVRVATYGPSSALAFSPDGRVLAIDKKTFGVSIGIIDPYTGLELRHVALPQ